MNALEKRAAGIGCTGLLLMFVLFLALWPQYNRYRREMAGRAALQQATWDRQIAVEEARAKMEADSLLALGRIQQAKGAAEAEIIRAVGLATAADTVIARLGSTEAYLRYRWIDEVAAQGGERIYIPTEAGIPILEAGAMRTAPVQP